MKTSTVVPDSNFVLVEEVGDKGIITLNRPKALNALNYEMIKKIATYLRKWQNSKSMILIKSAGGKAFCAGGDVRDVVEADTIEVGKNFFQTEYAVNYMIGNLKIPYMAFIDGITICGGVGLSVHGRFRIATEKSLFAMPETSVGIIPGSCCSYFLSRLPNKLGYYLGLTGFRLKGADVFHAGIATHYCESTKLPEIEQALLNLKNSNEVESVINSFCPRPNTAVFVLSEHLTQIDKSFSASSIEGILNNLEKDNNEWAKETIQTLRTFSPLSLKLTFHVLNLAANFSLGECLQLEYRVVMHCLEDSDYHEGVRAALIRKDNSPKWNPPRIEDVTEEQVASYFQPLRNNEDLAIRLKVTSKL